MSILNVKLTLYIPLSNKLIYYLVTKSKTRPSFRWISSTDTYKPHLALISAQMLERERERECERDIMRDNWSIRL